MIGGGAYDHAALVTEEGRLAEEGGRTPTTIGDDGIPFGGRGW